MNKERELKVIRESIAAIIVTRRQELGMTQKELADNSGVGEATIQRIESAKFFPGLKQLLPISFTLKLALRLIPVEELDNGIIANTN